MKRILQRIAQMMSEVVRALGAYRDLFLAWLDAAGTHIFPTPVKVRANRRQPPRRAAKPRR